MREGSKKERKIQQNGEGIGESDYGAEKIGEKVGQFALGKRVVILGAKRGTTQIRARGGKCGSRPVK